MVMCENLCRPRPCKTVFLTVVNTRMLGPGQGGDPTRLRGSLTPGHYRTDVPDWRRSVPELPDRSWFSGEPAVAILADYPKPASFTIYCTDEVPKEWVAKARPRRDRDGNVELLKSPIRSDPVRGCGRLRANCSSAPARLCGSRCKRRLTQSRNGPATP